MVPLECACWSLYNIRARSSCWPQDTRSSRNIREPNIFARRQRTYRTSGVAPVVVLCLSATGRRVSLVEEHPWRRSRDQSLLELRHWSGAVSPSKVAPGSIHLLPGCRDRRAGPGRNPSSWPPGPSLSAPCVQP
ncbi:unnamed protein product, partial [Ixodes hexagonus]